jgi:hypothetical protein
MSFSLSLKKLADKAGNNADAVVKKTILDVFSALQNKSPIDKGRFVNNWQIGIGFVNSDTSNGDDKSGAAALAKANAAVLGYSSKKVTYISNSLPYAQRLESGYSWQAPLGMVKLTLIEFRRKLRKAAR